VKKWTQELRKTKQDDWSSEKQNKKVENKGGSKQADPDTTLNYIYENYTYKNYIYMRLKG
jgi:hypothetical protein